MSKVIITIDDSGDFGVDIRTEFVPPLKSDQITTPAHHAYMIMLEALHGDKSVESVEDIDDDDNSPLF